MAQYRQNTSPRSHRETRRRHRLKILLVLLLGVPVTFALFPYLTHSIIAAETETALSLPEWRCRQKSRE
jgi:hypothetical protein